jgi:hypothetical protein
MTTAHGRYFFMNRTKIVIKINKSLIEHFTRIERVRYVWQVLGRISRK